MPPATVLGGLAVPDPFHRGSYVSRKTSSGIIDAAGLRTLCGPSGTTTDIIAVLHMFNPERTDIALAQMCDFALHGIPPGPELCQLFTSITFYMQTGKYHTFGEVAAGIFAAAFAGYTWCDIYQFTDIFSGAICRISNHPSAVLNSHRF
ncbi:MAG: hypothetical protein LBB38_03490 [Puniceicoccales bacterium]|jgi:hypothetical protein|nr:hypothetical protein [Puniceicoccales bacterium]